MLVFQSYCARKLIEHRLKFTKIRLKGIETKPGEDTAAMWRAILHAINPDWWTTMRQIVWIYLAAALYDEYGVFNYSDQLGAYDWLIWPFIGWLGMHSWVRSSTFEKIECTYYRKMYFASTSPAHEGTQTHSHA